MFTGPYIQLPHRCFCYFTLYFLWHSWMSLIWAVWFAVLELQQLFPRIHCSDMSITTVFAYCLPRPLLSKIYPSLFFFFFSSVTLSAICPSNNAPACNFSGGILHEEFCTLPLLLHKICQDGWGFHAALNRLSKNSFISTNVFTSAQSTKQFAKTNNLYIYSSFPTDKLFR